MAKKRISLREVLWEAEDRYRNELLDNEERQVLRDRINWLRRQEPVFDAQDERDHRIMDIFLAQVLMIVQARIVEG